MPRTPQNGPRNECFAKALISGRPGSAAAGQGRCSQGPKSQLGSKICFDKYLNNQ